MPGNFILTFMRVGLIVISLLFSAQCFPQEVVRGLVRDSKTKEPLPYCNIAVKNDRRGTITNGDGVFSIPVSLRRDTLLFSYVGYEMLVIPAARLSREKEIFLERKGIQLQEVTVHANDDFMFKILDRCRKTLYEDGVDHVSKVYYGVETRTDQQPVELLECYYNAYFQGPFISRMGFRNGRIGLAELDNRYFLTLNTSKAISELPLTNKNEHSPQLPLQMTLRELKKKYLLEMEYSDDKMYKIKFRPRKEPGWYFAGEIYIEKNTDRLIRIDLTVENAAIHPFLPLSPKDTLSHVDLKITRTFRTEGGAYLNDYISFNYDVRYKSVRDSVSPRVPFIFTRNIHTKGIMYFYDYDDPFILPYFEYDPGFDDYRKMSIIPYNEVFWNNNNKLLLTEKQKSDLGFFAQEGEVINYRGINYGKDFLTIVNTHLSNDTTITPFYEFYYTFWSPDQRIILNRKLRQNEVYTRERANQSIQSNLYRLKVQLLLDVTQIEDSMYFKSYTVFDANRTFYHLPGQPYTNAFLNIYFDLCETVRREMQGELESRAWSMGQVDSIYKCANGKMDSITQTYLKEVQLGKNAKELSTWNSYILTKLNIDNLGIFQAGETKSGLKD